MEISGSSGTYVLYDPREDLVRTSGTDSLYRVADQAGGREYLLQVAKTRADNEAIDRSAYFLKKLAEAAAAAEAAFAQVKAEEWMCLNYDVMFPQLVDTFRLGEEQGRRKANVLGFKLVPEVRLYVPVGNITARDRLRVDMRTSIWIMGKALKMLDFAHANGIEVGNLGSESLLIQPEQHFVCLFDWRSAVMHPQGVPQDIRRREIKELTSTVIGLLSGDADRRFFHEEDVPGFLEYTEYLLLLAAGGEADTQRAHNTFYAIVDKHYERKFYPFTTHPLDVH